MANTTSHGVDDPSSSEDALDQDVVDLESLPESDADDLEEDDSLTTPTLFVDSDDIVDPDSVDTRSADPLDINQDDSEVQSGILQAALTVPEAVFDDDILISPIDTDSDDLPGVVPQQIDEFTCPICYLILHVRLQRPSGRCRDCD
jgi:hypothetical protein